MAKGNTILCSAGLAPKGTFQPCIVSGTPSPGTVMEVVPNTEPVGNVFTYRAASRNDGATGGNPILDMDDKQGKLPTDAYVSGTYGRIYWPAAGEFFNMLLRGQSGTGTSLNYKIGDRLEVDGATGMLQGIGTGGPTGTHASAPWVLMEHLGVLPSGNNLVYVQYLGGGA